MLVIYSLENRLENQQQQKTFALNLSKGIRIKGELVMWGTKTTQKPTGKMSKALVQPLLVDKVSQSNAL